MTVTGRTPRRVQSYPLKFELELVAQALAPGVSVSALSRRVQSYPLKFKLEPVVEAARKRSARR
ncbi:MAG: hypothetical protein IT555_00345 [Acetobacteraceae bacterium]|nr:hypothetical protein [Acetobacteraceae bacterium]